MVPMIRENSAFKLLTIIGVYIGIGLPVAFLVGLPSAATHLNFFDLILLYGTEWVIFTAQGVTVALLATALYFSLRLIRQDIALSALEALLSLTIGFCMAFALMHWLEALPIHWAFEFRARHTLFAGMVFGIADFHWARQKALRGRLIKVSFASTLLGLIPLLLLVARAASNSIALPENPSASLPNQSVITRANSPNIVLITIDTLAASHLTPYGSARNTSPNLARLASYGIVFDHAYSNGNFTTPGVSSIITGQPPWSHRALQLAGRPLNSVGNRSFIARLASQGYEATYFGSNVYAGASRLGLSRFFSNIFPDTGDNAICQDRYEIALQRCTASTNPWIGFSIGLYSILRAEWGNTGTNAAASVRMEHRLEQWAPSTQDRPNFVWVHYRSPHDPYVSISPWLGSFNPMSDARSIADSLPLYGFTAVHSSPERIALLKDRYDESISEVDFHVERAIALLKQKLGANTAFIITADHGESFSHGYGGHGGPMLYEDVIHIPLLIEFPERLQAGLRQPANVSQADIAPTIADIAGIPPDPSWEGHSLLKTESVDTHRPIYSMNFEENVADGQLKNGSIALMRDGFKLVRFFGTLRYPDMPELTTQLFNLQSDPEEQHNLAADHPDIVKALSAVMDADFAKHAGAITKSSDSSTVKLH